jgi:hypothetical protein
VDDTSRLGRRQGRANPQFTADLFERARTLTYQLGGEWNGVNKHGHGCGRNAECPMPGCGAMRMSITAKPERKGVYFFCNACKAESEEIAQALTKNGHGFFSQRKVQPRLPTERELTAQAAEKMNEQKLPERARNVVRLVWWHVVKGGSPNGGAPITIKQFMAYLKTRSAWVVAKALEEAEAANWIKIRSASRGVGKGRAPNLYGVTWLEPGYQGNPTTKKTSATESVAESVAGNGICGVQPIENTRPQKSVRTPNWEGIATPPESSLVGTSNDPQGSTSRRGRGSSSQGSEAHAHARREEGRPDPRRRACILCDRQDPGGPCLRPHDCVLRRG